MPPKHHRNYSARERRAMEHPQCWETDTAVWAVWYVRGLDGEPWRTQVARKTDTTHRSDAARAGWCRGARERIKHRTLGIAAWMEPKATTSSAA